MGKHTPAPWVKDGNRLVHFEDGATRHDQELRSIPIKQQIALFAERTGQTQANMDICAAAPELLAACKAAVKDLPNDMFIWSEGDHGSRVCVKDMMAAAIAKAEGRV